MAYSTHFAIALLKHSGFNFSKWKYFSKIQGKQPIFVALPTWPAVIHYVSYLFQVSENHLSAQDVSDTATMPPHRSDSSGDSSVADQLVQAVNEVTAGTEFHYLPSSITRHALTGVF